MYAYFDSVEVTSVALRFEHLLCASSQLVGVVNSLTHASWPSYSQPLLQSSNFNIISGSLYQIYYYMTKTVPNVLIGDVVVGGDAVVTMGAIRCCSPVGDDEQIVSGSVDRHDVM